MAGVSSGPRLSAHVVPKPMMDDEEKTTIDPQWDDGSTTSEQHKVSQRLRALQDPRPSDSGISATAPPPAIARLAVTHGTDLGRSFEIHSGKAFTVGRSLDCDVVLTDIAVSRKHFDLRNEDGLWFIADRGSGNGTLVNNDLKNAPFQLVNGDIIEVGTTTLRFDCRATEIESEVSTISGRRQPSEIARLPEFLPAPVISPPAARGPQELLQASNARLPIMPTRPLVLGPHSPTLLAMDSPDAAHLLAAIENPSRRPASIARVPTHVPVAPSEIPLKEPVAAPPLSPEAAPILSTRAKIILAAAGAVTLGTIVVLGVVFSSKDVQVRNKSATATAATPKFKLPLSELKAAPKPAPPPTRASPAGPAVVGKTSPPAAKPAATVPPTTVQPAATAKPAPAPTVPAVAATAKPAPAPTVPAVAAAAKPAPAPTVPAVAAAAKPAPAPTVPAVAAAAKPAPAPTVPAVAAAAKPAPAPTVPAVAAAAPSNSNIDETVETVIDVRPKTKKRVATKRTDVDAAEAKAESLFRAEKFNEAADTLRTAARTTDRTARRTLENRAATYASFGKAYVQGMNANNPVQAFAYLRSASNFDQVLGGSFQEEIAARMKQVAPKAAVAYVAADKLSEAHLAVLAAERVGGSSDSNVTLVKQKLESAAAKLFSEAMGDLEDNPSEAKEKFRQIKEIVDPNSQWHAKASKQLSGN